MDNARQIANAAYVFSQAACALIEATAMNTANAVALTAKKPMPHSPDEISGLINKYGVHHNYVMETLYHGR